MQNEESFLMCEPRYFGVEYVINPWMEGNVGRADRARAREQWERLRETLAARASVELVAPVDGLPDMTFTANAGLVHGDTFIPARLLYPQRQPETPRVIDWFRASRLGVAPLAGDAAFEGEGDALFQPGEPLLWGGYGVRTSLLTLRALAETLDVEVIPLRLADPRFYHLDTCLCPLPGGRLIYYPAAFDRESLRVIEERIPAARRHELDEACAMAFAANAIVVDDAFIANFVGDALRRRLAEWGFEAVVTPMSEFMLSGGGAKCLALALTHPRVASSAGGTPAPQVAASGVCDREIEAEGHLLDQGLANRLLDCVTENGCAFETVAFTAAQHHDQHSRARLRVVAPSPARLETVLGLLVQLGARPVGDEADARLEPAARDGVAPRDFYSTTIFPTDVRVGGRWIRATGQRMDAALVAGGGGGGEGASVRCALMRDVRQGERVVCGYEGIRIHTHTAGGDKIEAFGFMTASASSERSAGRVAGDVAWEMRRIRERGGRIVVVPGPAVIHTGGGPHLARLIRLGCVQALLGGNAIAVHDIEQALFGTSLGVDLSHGTRSHSGHQHHLRAINTIRECGSIAAAVERGVLTSGVMYECVRQNVPLALAASIRDDGPLPETLTDMIAAQTEYARLLEGADMVLMLASMLHSIGVGNMTPAGVRLICVDINPAVVTKLADRGSVESVGVVTDVGLFLELLARLVESGG